MIKITKDEAKKLRAMGVYDGENGISTTHSHHHKANYLTESRHNIRLLNEIRGVK